MQDSPRAFVSHIKMVNWRYGRSWVQDDHAPVRLCHFINRGSTSTASMASSTFACEPCPGGHLEHLECLNSRKLPRVKGIHVIQPWNPSYGRINLGISIRYYPGIDRNIHTSYMNSNLEVLQGILCTKPWNISKVECPLVQMLTYWYNFAVDLQILPDHDKLEHCSVKMWSRYLLIYVCI